MPAQDCPLRKPPTRRVAAALAGCGDGKQELTAGEVQRALAEVPYAVQLQPTQRGENENGEVITGTAKDRDGTRLGVAVAVGGADMPKAILDRLGNTDYSTWKTGWSEAYGIDPGFTDQDRVREVRHPSKSLSDTPRTLQRQRGHMELKIEDALCRYVECKFFPD